jgi:hypothetical protein
LQRSHPAGSTGTRIGISIATKRLADEVEREALDQGLLRGTYILTLDGPYDSFGRSKKEMKKLLMDFVASTSGVDHVPMMLEPSETLSGQRYFLQKAGPEKNLIGIAMMGDGADWGWSIVEELLALVKDAINSKAHKLRAVPHPWVLLLLDRHHVSTAMEYEEVRNRLAGPGTEALALGQFHSVLVVDWQGQVIPMHPPSKIVWDTYQA